MAQTAEASAEFGDADEIRRQLDEILAQPEFRRVHIQRTGPAEESKIDWPDWLKDFFDWLGSFFGKMWDVFSALGFGYQLLAYAVLAVICGLIVLMLVRAIQRYQRQWESLGRKAVFEEGEADIPPGDLPADTYLARAAEFATQGRYREAIGQLILGGMSHAERAGLIRYRRGLTHRDYLRAFRSRVPQQQAFRTMVGVYEPICFGRRPAGVEHYETSRVGYETGFGGRMSKASGE